MFISIGYDLASKPKASPGDKRVKGMQRPLLDDNPQRLDERALLRASGSSQEAQRQPVIEGKFTDLETPK